MCKMLVQISFINKYIKPEHDKTKNEEKMILNFDPRLPWGCCHSYTVVSVPSTSSRAL